MIKLMYDEPDKLTFELRILNYFNANRDEQLSLEDACVKFDVSLTQAKRVMHDMVKRKLLKVYLEPISSLQRINIYERAW